MRETRSFYVPLELRAGGDGRTVGGLVMPYETPTEIREAGGSYTEVFRAGAFAKSISERGNKTKLYVEHGHQQNKLPIGRATNLAETKAGLLGDFYVSRTRDGDEALELVRDGAVDAFSVGFEPVLNEWSRDRTVVERTEARLWEVSLVAMPAYENALVTSVRSDVDPEESEEEAAEPEGDEPEEEVDEDNRARRTALFTRATADFDAHLSRLERSEQ